MLNTIPNTPTDRHAIRIRMLSEYQNSKNRKIDFAFGKSVINAFRDETSGLVAVTNLPTADEFKNFKIGLLREYGDSRKKYAIVESTMLRCFSLTKVSSREGLGDGRSPSLGEVEIKMSIVYDTPFSVQQIRPERSLHYYLLSLYALHGDYGFLGFVPGHVMKEQFLGSVSHGTTSSVAGNRDPEHSIKSISILKDQTMNATLEKLDCYNYYGGGANLVH